MHIIQNGVPVNWNFAVERLFELEQGGSSSCKRAFKSPSLIRSQPGMQGIRDSWPQTQVVIGLRHPVTWIQSLYNFKIFRQNISLPQLRVNMTKCRVEGFCLQSVLFHYELAKLGKTALIEADEMNLLEVYKEFDRKLVLDPPSPNNFFLYEFSELHTEDLRFALGEYLNLKRPLAKLGDYQNHQTTTKIPGQIDICEDQHFAVRQKLLEIGDAAAQWIDDYFLRSPDVVTAGASFQRALMQWRVDPCESVMGNSSTPRRSGP